jgi:hypothetical protein
MEREILRLESLARAAFSAPPPNRREREIAETLRDCLRELHAASARIARARCANHCPKIVR